MLGTVIPADRDNNDNAANTDEETLAEQTIPASVNWAATAAWAYVRNQGSCGSCYAFAAVGTMEAAIWIKSQQVVNLAEQQILDCSGPYGNAGCGGGWMDYAFSYAKSHKIAFETAYPYVGR